MSDADRQQMAADLANSQWQKALVDYATMASAQQSGDNDQYQKAAADLKLQLSYFAMCATDAQWNNNVATYFSNPAWAPYLTVAQDYARGANELLRNTAITPTSIPQRSYSSKSPTKPSIAYHRSELPIG